MSQNLFSSSLLGGPTAGISSVCVSSFGILCFVVDSAELEVALLWSVGCFTYILLAVVIISTSIIFVKFIE